MKKSLDTIGGKDLIILRNEYLWEISIYDYTELYRSSINKI